MYNYHCHVVTCPNLPVSIAWIPQVHTALVPGYLRTMTIMIITITPRRQDRDTIILSIENVAQPCSVWLIMRLVGVTMLDHRVTVLDICDGTVVSSYSVVFHWTKN